MRHFIYFFPGAPGMNPEMLSARGCLDRFTSSPAGAGGLIVHSVSWCAEGPAGSGAMVYAGQEPLTYEPDRFRWARGPDHWVGVDIKLPPLPDDLARDVGIGGEMITLADGQKWKCPRVLIWDQSQRRHRPNVPTSFVPTIVDGTRRLTEKVNAGYEPIMAIAERAFAAFTGERSPGVDEFYFDAVALLAVNHRIGPEEAGLLGLLDEAAILRILELAIDLPGIEEQTRKMSRVGLEFAEPAAEEFSHVFAKEPQVIEEPQVAEGI